MGDTLGCGTYEVLLLSRGGRELLGEFSCTALEWQRMLDDTSQATVRTDGCPDVIPRSWRHEVGIYRDGQLVWAGPVYQPHSEPSGDHQQLVVLARGISAWWDRRRIHHDHDYSLSPTDLAYIFAQLSIDAMQPDNSPGLTVATTPTGIKGVVVVKASQNLMAGAELRTLADAGLDWTEVGRDILCGGTTVPTADLGTLTDEDFAFPPTVTYDGSSQANSETVIGAGIGADGSTIYATSADAAAATLDGLLELTDTASSLQDYDSVLASAESLRALVTDPVLVSNCVLSPDAPVTIDQLVAGATVRLELTDTLLPVSGRYRLQQLDVSVQFASGELTEQVKPTFQPEGTT